MGQQIRKLLARGAAVASIALASLFGFGSPAQAGEGFWSSNNTCTGSSSVTFTPGNSVTAYLCTNFAIINYACDFGIKLRAADAATDAAQFAVTNRALPAAIVAPANSVTYPEAVVAAPIPTSNYDWGGYFSTSIPPVGYDVGGQSSFLLATFTFSTKSTSTSGPYKIELDSAYPSYISIAPAASGSSGCGNAEIGNNFDTPIPQLTLTPAAPPPVISTTSLPAGTVGTAYSQPLAASNSPTNWVVSTGTLPAGLTLAAATGVISGTPTAPGTSNFSVTASNGTVSAPKALSITINAMPKPVVNPSPNGSSAPNLLSEARTSVAYSFTLQASNSPTAWSFIGATPAWLSLSNTGVLSGTPPAGSSGMLSVTVTATNAGGTSDQVKFSIPITVVGEPIITTPAGALPGGTVGALYRGTAAGLPLFVYSSTPLTGCAVSAGTLPAGLSISPTCAISGTPTAAGTSNFSVTATNAQGSSVAVAYTITISTLSAGDAAAVPTLSQWGLILLGMLLAGFGLSRRQRHMR